MTFLKSTAPLAGLCLAAALFTQPALADSGLRADDHAPIGVMGDHFHKKGEWMVSYRYMRMDMEGSRDGTDSLSNGEILTVPNTFFGQPMQPPFLRVIPLQMTMDMHMVGAMYAPADWLTLMAMGMYVEKEMDHATFNPAGVRIGGFTTEVSGFGDTSVSALIRLYQDDHHRVHLNAGLSIPTGGTKETDKILAPNGMTTTVRLPYSMQLGSGTFDLKPGITYAGFARDWSWGAQLSATLRLDESDQGYSHGAAAKLTGWLGYRCADWVSTSARVTGWTLGEIEGRDAKIIGPVQTADPGNYGGKQVWLGLGANFALTEAGLKGHRLGVEVELPLYRDLNGPQVETDWMLTVGWQYSF